MFRCTVAALVLVTLTSACSAGGDGGESASDGDATPEIMAAALARLVAADHTFGEGPPPFTEYLIQETIDLTAGSGLEAPSNDARALTGDEQAAIESAISEFGPVRWIGDPADWRTEDLTPVVEGSAILGVGEPSFDGDAALVPVSMWCGGLCGTWLTYRVELVNGAWEVTGTEGPIAIS